MTQCTLLYHLYIMLGEEETKKKKKSKIIFFLSIQKMWWPINIVHPRLVVAPSNHNSSVTLSVPDFVLFLSHLIDDLLKLCWFYVKRCLEHHQITKLPLRFVRAVVCRLTWFKFLIDLSLSISLELYSFQSVFSMNFLIKHDNWPIAWT